jgi:hypothetical protein
MKTKIACWIGIWTVLVGLMSACVPNGVPSIGPCIKPSFTLAFPTHATAQPGALESRKRIFPSGDWRIDATIPGPIPDLIDSLVSRPSHEIWMTVSHNSSGRLVYRYRTDTHQWTSYDSIDGIPLVPDSLVVTSDNTLWGVAWTSQSLNGNPSGSHPILSRFDDGTDQFKFVDDPEAILQLFTAPSSPPIAVADGSGTLWMILAKGNNTPGGLYRYDPHEGILSRQLPEVELSGHGSLAIAPDQDVWIFDPTTEEKLIQYHVATGKYRADFINLSDWNIKNWSGGLYFDRSGKLWSGKDGWIDFTNPDFPVWYQIIPSPVFITDYSDGGNQYTWTEPYGSYQSSNGWYWFPSPENGIIQLNAETGEWCRFTTEYSPVVEDSQQNIRIVISGKIYLLRLKP